MKYDEAIKELEKIVQKIENGEMDIDDVSSNIKRAKEIINLCKDKLTKAEESLKD